MKKKLLVFVMLVFLATLASAEPMELNTGKGHLKIYHDPQYWIGYSLGDEYNEYRGDFSWNIEVINGGYGLIIYTLKTIEVDGRVYGYNEMIPYLRKYGVIDFLDSDLNLRILLPPDFEAKVYESNDCVTFNNMPLSKPVNSFVCLIHPSFVETIKSHSKEELDDYYDLYFEEVKKKIEKLKKAGYY